MTSTANIACKVSRGMFSTERIVQIDLPEGKPVSALVDHDSVIVKSDPLKGKVVDGKVKVSIVRQAKGRVLIDLPGSGITNGTRIWVPKSWLIK